MKLSSIARDGDDGAVVDDDADSDGYSRFHFQPCCVFDEYSLCPYNYERHVELLSLQRCGYHAEVVFLEKNALHIT